MRLLRVRRKRQDREGAVPRLQGRRTPREGARIHRRATARPRRRRWRVPGEAAKVPYVTQTLKDAQGPFVAASDYMKILPESLGKWVPGQLVSLGTDGFGRSENRAALRDFFEVDAKHIVLAMLGALAREKKIGTDVVKRAVQELGIKPEKPNPAVS